MAEFAEAKTAVLKMNVDLNASGNICQDGETAAGQKVISINGFKATGTLANANTVFDKLIGNIAGGNYDTLSASKVTTQGVSE